PAAVTESATPAAVPAPVEAFRAHVSGILRRAADQRAQARVIGEIDGNPINGYLTVGESIGGFTLVAIGDDNRSVVFHGYGYAIQVGLDQSVPALKTPLKSR
ncbi:MAG: hypothetical protein ACT4PL_08290, partial [Phycisphaerales bacterium]